MPYPKDHFLTLEDKLNLILHGYDAQQPRRLGKESVRDWLIARDQRTELEGGLLLDHIISLYLSSGELHLYQRVPYLILWGSHSSGYGLSFSTANKSILEFHKVQSAELDARVEEDEWVPDGSSWPEGNWLLHIFSSCQKPIIGSSAGISYVNYPNKPTQGFIMTVKGDFPKENDTGNTEFEYPFFHLPRITGEKRITRFWEAIAEYFGLKLTQTTIQSAQDFWKNAGENKLVIELTKQQMVMSSWYSARIGTLDFLFGGFNREDDPMPSFSVVLPTQVDENEILDIVKGLYDSGNVSNIRLNGHYLNPDMRGMYEDRGKARHSPLAIGRYLELGHAGLGSASRLAPVMIEALLHRFFGRKNNDAKPVYQSRVELSSK